MALAVGLLFIAAGVGLIIVAKPTRAGEPRAFLCGSDTRQAAYATLLTGCIAVGIVLSLAAGL
jgi:hypothetical protein